MENAAKALTMAAGVLIGVIIITIAVYLFTTLGNTSSEVYSKVEQEKIDKFNNQFLKYDGLANCTAHDIVSIANLAKIIMSIMNLQKEVDTITMLMSM